MRRRRTAARIERAELRVIPPVEGGLALLKADIRSGEHVFCTCVTAPAYHLGVKDSEETFERAMDRGLLKIVRESAAPEERIYVPVTPSSTLRPVLAHAERKCRAHVQRAHIVLRDAYPDYEPAKPRLADQGRDIHDRFVDAFVRLQHANILPVTTGNSAFNHQGMVLIMEQAFRRRDRLIDYLRNPELLTLDEPDSDGGYADTDPTLDRALRERARLLQAKYARGVLESDEAQALEEITTRIESMLAPRQAELDQIKIDIQLELTAMQRANTRRRAALRRAQRALTKRPATTP